MKKQGGQLAQLSEDRPAFMANQIFKLGGVCNMEGIIPGRKVGKEVLILRDESPIQITGWGADDVKKISPKSIYLRLQDKNAKEYYALTEKVKRPDVVDYFKKDFYLESGYKINLDVKKIPLGEYQAMIVMDFDGLSILCSSGTYIKIQGDGK